MGDGIEGAGVIGNILAGPGAGSMGPVNYGIQLGAFGATWAAVATVNPIVAAHAIALDSLAAASVAASVGWVSAALPIATRRSTNS